jgi:hypothetical protein
LWAFYTANSSSQITLNDSATWPGDSGPVAWIIDGTTNALVLAQSNDDPMMAENWSCVWNSSTQITLNRPWDGPSGTYDSYSANIAGKATQPFMLGVKQHGLRWGGLAAAATGNSVLAANFTNLEPAASCGALGAQHRFRFSGHQWLLLLASIEYVRAHHPGEHGLCGRRPVFR